MGFLCGPPAAAREAAPAGGELWPRPLRATVQSSFKESRSTDTTSLRWRSRDSISRRVARLGFQTS
jgi:hypothetical protein